MEERLKLIICWNLWTRSTDPWEPGAKQYSLGLWLSPACCAQAELLGKGIYETAVLKSSRAWDPSCSAGVAIVKLISSMVPPHLPELEGQSPFFTPRSLIQSGAQHILPLCLHSLCSALYIVHAKSLQSCLTLCDPMDSSPPGSSVHGILQARILEWVAMPSSRGSFQPRDWTCVSYFCCIGRWVLYL